MARSSKKKTPPKKKSRFDRAAKKAPKRHLFRDLENDGVTYSFLSEFMLCREQARLSYVEGYTRDGLVEALDFGTLFHKGMEMIAANKSVKLALTGISSEANDIIRNRRLKKSDADDILLLADKARLLFPYYHEYWKRKNGHEFRGKYIAREESFRMVHKIPWLFDADNGGLQQRDVVLRGRFDAVLRINGRLWLMENKTKSQIDEEGLTASLSQDLQTMLYSHAIRMKWGEEPAGVLYNVIRRPQFRLKQNESVDELLERIDKDVREFPDKYFMRWEVTFAKGDIDRWVQQSLDPILKQVCFWWDEIKENPFNPWSIPNRMHHFRNPEGLYNRYGKSQYFELLTRNSTYGLRKRDK